MFIGLYSTNERRGPGVLVYEDETVEVGLWIRDQLVRVLSDSEVQFSLTTYPEFDYKRDDVLPVVSFNALDTASDNVLRSIARDAICPSDALNYDEPSSLKALDRMAAERLDSVNTRQLAEYDRTGQKSRPASSRGTQQPDARSQSVSGTRGPLPDIVSAHDPKHKSAPGPTAPAGPAGDRATSSAAAFGASELLQPPGALTTRDRDGESNSNTITFRPFNPTPSSIEMQKHILRHESERERVELNVNAILSGDRSVFDPPPVPDLPSGPGVTSSGLMSAEASFASASSAPGDQQQSQSPAKKGRRTSISRRGSISLLNGGLPDPSSLLRNKGGSNSRRGSVSLLNPDPASLTKNKGASKSGPAQAENIKSTPPRSGRRASLSSRRLSAQFGRSLLPDSDSILSIPEIPVEVELNVERMPCLCAPTYVREDRSAYTHFVQL